MGPRIAAGAAIVVVAAIGVYLSGKLERDSRDRVVMLEADKTDVSTVRTAAAHSDPAPETGETFDRGAIDDAKAMSLPAFDPATLRAAQKHRVLIDEPVVLAPKRGWAQGQVRVDIKVEKVRYQQHGASVSAKHSIAVITNGSKRPLAYYARLRSAQQGLCDVRGARMHNAMALMPGESAEVVVCAGGGQVRVDRLEVLEISPLGYHYLSRVPPRTVGHDGTTAGAHRPLNRVSLCKTVDAKGVGGQLRQGLTRWVDVADFYSRHSCERYRFFLQYRHHPGEVALPARPPAPDAQ